MRCEGPRRESTKSLQADGRKCRALPACPVGARVVFHFILRTDDKFFSNTTIDLSHIDLDHKAPPAKSSMPPPSDAAAASSTMTFVGVIKSICATALQPKTIDVLRSISATRCIMGSFSGSQRGVRDFTRFIRMIALFVVAANVLLLHGYQNILLPLASIIFFAAALIEIITMEKADPHSDACSCKNLCAAILGCVMAAAMVLTSFVLSATSESGHVVKAIANAVALWFEVALIYSMVLEDGNKSRDDRGELPDGIHQGFSAMV
jgi:hypothetical protein